MSQMASRATEITWNIFPKKIHISIERFNVTVTLLVIMVTKFVPVHTMEAFRGEWRYNSTHSSPQHQVEINDQLEAPAASTPYITDYESVRSAEKKIPSPLPGFQPRIFKSVAQSPYLLSYICHYYYYYYYYEAVIAQSVQRLCNGPVERGIVCRLLERAKYFATSGGHSAPQGGASCSSLNHIQCRG